MEQFWSLIPKLCICSMISREAEQELRNLARQFKSVAVVGPRQSGKTTLVKAVFKDKAYVNLENPDIRMFAKEDPRGFLSAYPNGALLDEIQRVPELFSYLQQVLDDSEEKGLFILTGSNNFLIQENIAQSLVGRVAYLFLLPLSLTELNRFDLSSDSLMIRGGYPGLLSEEVQPHTYYSNYIRTYVERDVRLIKNITHLYTFEKFVKLCAGRIGQLLNMNSLAAEVGVDSKTIASWIGVLETSFVVFRMYPYFQNYNKRLVKMPKLYFYDTGLAALLLGMKEKDQLILHPYRGALFENLVILEILKKRYNKGVLDSLYFWKNSTGNEIDLLLDSSKGTVPIEIKSGKTITVEYFKGLNYWMNLSGVEKGFVVYDGEDIQHRSNGIKVLPLNKMEELMKF